MKKIIIFIAMTLIIASSAYSQYMDILFDDTTYKKHLTIDNGSNSNNIWQVGKPQKSIFTSAYSIPNAIITDTINSYPINDTSQFIISHKIILPNGVSYCGTGNRTSYRVNSDTITDFGKIEFSFDIGQTWMNILTDTNLIERDYPYIAPIFSGNSDGWKYFRFRVHSNNITYNGDTVLFRYTFISDNIQTNKDGLMFDDIYINDCGEGIEELGYNLIFSNAFPNPTNDNLTIKFENKNNSIFNIQILDFTGKIVKTCPDVKNNFVTITIQDLSSGIYYYKLTNTSDKKYAMSKFVKQ